MVDSPPDPEPIVLSLKEILASSGYAHQEPNSDLTAVMGWGAPWPPVIIV